MRYLLFAAAVLAVAVAGSVSMTGVSEAQVPTRFFGTVTIDGQPAAAGTTVTAEIGGNDCGSGAVESRQGQMLYILDAQSEASVAGCGGLNVIVFFKVGSRYASQIGCFTPGAFVEQNLTISGAAQRPTAAPGQCGTGTAPTPTATPSPTPTPSAGMQFSVSILDMNSPCIPVSGQSTCDGARNARWNGDQTAWTTFYEMQGLAAPTPDQVFEATLGLRVEAGDPGAIAALAQQLGWPHVRINAARYRGQSANEQDEWVEVKNLGGAEQDMTNWSVRVPGTEIRWTFQESFILQPGQACKFYTGAQMADPCPGSSNVSGSGVLNNSAGTIELWVDWLDLKAIETRYNSDPNNQPPPPNLQGFS